MIYRGKYHRKKLLWFRGFTPTHWLLEVGTQGLKARSLFTREEIKTGVGAGQLSHWEEPMAPELVAMIEEPVAGSLAAVMGYDFVLCEGQPGATVLNRRLNFPAPAPNSAQPNPQLLAESLTE
jgi:hypothetical protein